MAQRDKLFSRRYSKIIEEEQTKENNFFSDFTWDAKCDLTRIMATFNQPIKVQNGRYDQSESEVPILNYVDSIINELIGYSYFNISFDNITRENLKMLYIPNLLDVLEFQYEFLSENEQKDFREQINFVLQDNECPWILFEDGRLIKIDSRQFEQDIKNKQLNDLTILKNDDKKFQSAFDELNAAITFLSKGDYAEAINNAEKAYESVLKVASNINGQAKDLISKFLETFNVILPVDIKKEGFITSVLMSLPYIRNKSGASHGNGANEAQITKELANLAINLSCSLCTFVLDNYRKANIKDKNE